MHFAISGSMSKLVILSIHDKIEKFSIFSDVYENKIFGTLEPKLEPPKFTIPCGRPLKSEKSMFFKPVSLKIIQNLIFKLWIEQDDSWADFDIHKWSLFWSPWNPTAKNTLKISPKLKLNFFQQKKNCCPGALFWAPIFIYL